MTDPSENKKMNKEHPPLDCTDGEAFRLMAWIRTSELMERFNLSPAAVMMIVENAKRGAPTSISRELVVSALAQMRACEGKACGVTRETAWETMNVLLDMHRTTYEFAFLAVELAIKGRNPEPFTRDEMLEAAEEARVRMFAREK